MEVSTPILHFIDIITIIGDIMSYFSEKLKELRLYKDMRQSDVAAELSLPLTTYNYYENGKTEPSIETLIKIACYFDITLDELVGIEPKNKLQEEQNNDITELIKNYKKLNKEQRQHVRIVISTFLQDKEKIYKEIFTDNERDTDIFKRK
jgi:transcriptional regulator with XRE-family HTH domain